MIMGMPAISSRLGPKRPINLAVMPAESTPSTRRLLQPAAEARG